MSETLLEKRLGEILTPEQVKAVVEIVGDTPLLFRWVQKLSVLER